jgi:hypothetical protein
MKVRFFDIEWATDGQSLEKCGLPTECVLEIDEELAKDYDTVDGYLDEEATTLLSDQYGFLLNGCKYEVVKQIVNITVEGGVIQHVECPPGVKVVVRDYDVDGSEADLNEDENGDKFIEGVWG